MMRVIIKKTLDAATSGVVRSSWCILFLASYLQLQSSLYKCYPYKRYNIIYGKKILLPYKNTIGKTSECYVLSVMTCFTPFFVNYTSISVNLEKIKVTIVCQSGKF